MSQLAAGLKLETDQTHTIIVLRGKTVRLIGFSFELGKCFLLPEALAGIREVTKRCSTLGATHLLIVGHADSTGNGEYNLALSNKRAQRVAAYFTDDAAVWLPSYDDSDPEQRWGAREDRLMLGAVLDASGLPYLRAGTDVGTAIRRFQADFGLAVDGDCGPQTRAQLVPAYMALDGTTLPDGVAIAAIGAGEAHPRPDLPPEHRDQRRVEVFLSYEAFDPQAEPPSASEYETWQRLSSATIDVRIPEGRPLVEIILHNRGGQLMKHAWYRVFVGDALYVWDRADFRGIARFEAPGSGKVILVWGADHPDGPYRYVREIFTDVTDEERKQLHNLGYDTDVDLEEGTIAFQACRNVDESPVPRGLTEGTLPQATRDALLEYFSDAQQLRCEAP